MMKLYLAIVASLLTPAHGAAVDVLDAPAGQRRSLFLNVGEVAGTAGQAVGGAVGGAAGGFANGIAGGGGSPGGGSPQTPHQTNNHNSGQVNPCFSRDTYACRFLDPKAPAAEAYAQCFLGAAGDAATRALMSELVAGDTVLSDADTAARVVVNQHKIEDGKASLLVTLTHARGSLALTPDHVLELDGKFVPAREAHVGAALSNGAVIEAISYSRGGIINPITATGKIFAAAATGEPVVAATGNEWLADVMLSAYPKYTLSYTLAAAFPAAVQAYYDGALEPLFTAAVPHLTKIKAAAPAPLVGVILVAGDAALATGFAAYSLGLKGVATLAVIAVAAARKGKKP